MTNPTTPPTDALREAAAEAVWDASKLSGNPHRWADFSLGDRESYYRIADAVLALAKPTTPIRDDAGDEARARLQVMVDSNCLDDAYLSYPNRMATMIADVRRLLAFRAAAKPGEG